jgi:hypothetical protein
VHELRRRRNELQKQIKADRLEKKRAISTLQKSNSKVSRELLKQKMTNEKQQCVLKRKTEELSAITRRLKDSVQKRTNAQQQRQNSKLALQNLSRPKHQATLGQRQQAHGGKDKYDGALEYLKQQITAELEVEITIRQGRMALETWFEKRTALTQKLAAVQDDLDGGSGDTDTLEEERDALTSTLKGMNATILALQQQLAAVDGLSTLSADGSDDTAAPVASSSTALSQASRTSSSNQKQWIKMLTQKVTSLRQSLSLIKWFFALEAQTKASFNLKEAEVRELESQRAQLEKQATEKEAEISSLQTQLQRFKPNTRDKNKGNKNKSKKNAKYEYVSDDESAHSSFEMDDDGSDSDSDWEEQQENLRKKRSGGGGTKRKSTFPGSTLQKRASSNSSIVSAANTSLTSSNGALNSSSVSEESNGGPLEDEPEEWTREEIARRKLTVAQLKVFLKARGLTVSGTKEKVWSPVSHWHTLSCCHRLFCFHILPLSFSRCRLLSNPTLLVIFGLFSFALPPASPPPPPSSSAG